MKKLKLLWLYPDIFNLHGDRGNIFAFKRVADDLGIELTVERIDRYGEHIDFAGADMILISPGETVVCEKAAAVLMPFKDEICRFIDSGRIMLVIGNSLSVFAGRTVRRDGSSFDGLGIIDAQCTELRTAYSNDAVFDTAVFGDAMEVVGGQIQMLKFVLAAAETPLGNTVYGYGNARDGREGVIKNGFIHTNLLGPVFVKNPWFAAAVLKKALRDDTDGLRDMPDYELERRSDAEIKRFIDKKVKLYDKTRLDDDL